MSSGTDGFSDNDMEESPPAYSSLFEEDSINPPLPVSETDEKPPATFQSKKIGKPRRTGEISLQKLADLSFFSHGRWPFQHRPECRFADICSFANLGGTGTEPKNNRYWARKQAGAIFKRWGRRNV